MILMILLGIFTIYTDQTFRTECAVLVNASPAVADILVDSLVCDFQNNPEHLFDWAFSGLGKQNDETKESFLIEYKTTAYDPSTGKGKVIMDVIVPHVKRLKDICIDGAMKDRRGSYTDYDTISDIDGLRVVNIKKYSRNIFISANYSGNFLETAYGNLYIVPLACDKTIYIMDMHVKFGWFFNMFISKRLYKRTMEWRIARYIENLKTSAEILQGE